MGPIERKPGDQSGYMYSFHGNFGDSWSGDPGKRQASLWFTATRWSKWRVRASRYRVNRTWLIWTCKAWACLIPEVFWKNENKKQPKELTCFLMRSLRALCTCSMFLIIDYEIMGCTKENASYLQMCLSLVQGNWSGFFCFILNCNLFPVNSQEDRCFQFSLEKYTVIK